MEKIEKPMILVAYGFIAIALIATGVALVMAVPKSVLDSKEWPAWVQAVGSVVAIAVAFLVASRQHKADRALEMDIRSIDECRRFDAVNAILARATAVALIIDEAWKHSAMDSIHSNVDDYVLDSKASIEALPIFEIPDADLIVYMVNLPRALQELKEVLAQARMESENQEQIQFPAADDLGPKINEVLEITSCAAKICNQQVAIRKP